MSLLTGRYLRLKWYELARMSCCGVDDFFLIILAAMALFASGCSGPGTGQTFVADELRHADKMRVAILPLENLSDNPNAGVIVSQVLSTELYSRHLFNLLEESELRRELSEKKLDVNRLEDATVANKLGKELGVQAILVGSVSEYAYQHGLREEPAVGVFVRLIRAVDGKVLWTSSRSGIGAGFLQRDSLVHVTQRVVDKMVDDLHCGMIGPDEWVGCLTGSPPKDKKRLQRIHVSQESGSEALPSSSVSAEIDSQDAEEAVTRQAHSVERDEKPMSVEAVAVKHSDEDVSGGWAALLGIQPPLEESIDERRQPMHYVGSAMRPAS